MPRKGRFIRINSQRPEWHEAFFAHAEAAFAVDFRQWVRHLGWSRGYEVAALVEEERIVSTVGITRMALSLADPDLGSDFRRLVEGVQLGCIATVADRRGTGLGRALMAHVLEEVDAKGWPALLFSSREAKSYYPAFGFQPVESVRYRLERRVEPAAGRPLPRFDVTAARDRGRLAALLTGSRSHGGGLSARSDPWILMWYLFNRPARALVLPGGKALVFVEEEGETLFIREWLGEKPRNLDPVLPALASRPMQTVEFGFVPPSGWLMRGFVPEPDPEGLLFQRGLALAAGAPVCFPDFLRT